MTSVDDGDASELNAEIASIEERVQRVEAEAEALVRQMVVTQVPLPSGERIWRLGSIIIPTVRELLDGDELTEDRRGFLALDGFMVGDREQSARELVRQLSERRQHANPALSQLRRARFEGIEELALELLVTSQPRDTWQVPSLLKSLVELGVEIPADTVARLRSWRIRDVDVWLDHLGL